MTTKRTWSGLESVGLQPMSDADRVLLDERARTQGLKLAGWLVAFPLLPIGGCLLMSVGDANVVLVVVACLLFLVGPAVAALAASDAYQRRRALRRALERGEVEVFRGMVKPLVAVDPVLVKLAKRGFLREGSEESHEVQLLPESGFVHRVDGQRVDAYLTPEVLQTAAPRPVSPIAEKPGAFRVVMLTDEEREEVRARARRLWKTPGSVIFLVCYVALGAFMWRVGGGEWLGKYGVQFGIFSLAALAALWRFVGRIRLARRLERDAAQGEVVTVFADEPNPDGSVSQLMLLPHAQMVWSLDGQPAEWRSEKL